MHRQYFTFLSALNEFLRIPRAEDNVEVRNALMDWAKFVSELEVPTIYVNEIF